MTTTEMTVPTSGSKKSGVGTWILWALGIRTPRADSEYGERLANYRRWSGLPVSIMSMAVFLLIIVKLVMVFTAFFAAFNELDPEAIVLQYSLSTPVETIVIGVMAELFLAVWGAFPLYLHIPLILMWLLAFVVDFIVAATLAENKKLWWKRHWGGIITAIITIP